MSGLIIDNVTVTYRNGHTALHNASFTIPQGSIAALVGVNGSGKSTLFKSIMGFVPVSQGEVNIMGMAAKRALKQNIVAYVPQSEEIDWNFPVLVEDVVMMGRYGYMNMFRIPRAEDHQQVTSALERVDMVPYRKRQIGELSGGQRKRVFLARALAQESKVILLDEPFTGVDVQTEKQIMALLRALRDEGKVLHYSLLALLSLTIVAALKAVGMILVISMLIAPGATAFMLTSRFQTMVGLALLISVTNAFFGMYLSFFIDSAPGPTIILLLTINFIGVFTYTAIKNRYIEQKNIKITVTHDDQHAIELINNPT